MARVMQDQIDVVVRSRSVDLPGFLGVPAGAGGTVVFAHGSGSSRLSGRNQYVASTLRDAGLATLLFDLLTPAEEHSDAIDGRLRFDIPFLAGRVVGAVDWLSSELGTADLNIGLFGASTGAAAALIAATERPDVVQAVVSRGGRPDLAAEALPRMGAPALLIVGGHDDVVIELNRKALAGLTCTKRLEIVPGATHLFEEPGTLEQAAALARDWFLQYLSGAAKPDC